MPIETVDFGGSPISRLIKGGWQLHEQADHLDRAKALAAMHAFADAGISVIETADSYRGVETLVGEFLAERRHRGPSPVRVHTRLTVPVDDVITAERIDRAVAATRGRLGVDCLDLLQLSMWRFDRDRWRGTAEELVRLQHAGWIQGIGVMNVDVDGLAVLRDAGIPIASAQAQFSLIDRRAERSLLPACRASGIAFFGYGALAGGFIARRWLGRDDPGHAGHPEYRAMIDAFGGWPLFQRLLVVLNEIAARHTVDIGTIALRWALDRPGVTAMLVGASDTSHLPELVRLSSIKLDAGDIANINEVLAASRGPGGAVGVIERDPEGPVARAIALRGVSPTIASA